MPLQKTIKQIGNAWSFFLILLLGIAICTSMQMMEAGIESGLWRYATVATFLVWGLSVFKIFFRGYYLYRPSLPIICYSLFLLWTFIPTVAFGKTTTTSNQIIDICWILLPFLVLTVSYNTIKNFGPSKWDVAAFCLISLMAMGQYFLIFRELNIFIEHSHLACSYFALYLLPLVFISKSKTVRLIFAFLAILVVVSSVKRGGVVALVLALLTYVVCWMFVAKRLRLSIIIIGLVGLFALASLVYAIGVSDEDNNVFERFETLEEDQGSNRVLVWGISVIMIERSDATGFIAGHGYNSVVADSPIMLSAHNDFIEVTYDYGLIGIILYIISILAVILYLLNMMWRKSEYAPPLAMMMVAYLSLSMMSHVIIYFFANAVMLTFGYVIGRYEYENNDNKVETR